MRMMTSADNDECGYIQNARAIGRREKSSVRRGRVPAWLNRGRNTSRALAPIPRRTAQTFLEMYLTRRANLKLLVLLADARREPLDLDAEVLQFAQDRADRPYKLLVVATKVSRVFPRTGITLRFTRAVPRACPPPSPPARFLACLLGVWGVGVAFVLLDGSRAVLGRAVVAGRWLA